MQSFRLSTRSLGYPQSLARKYFPCPQTKASQTKTNPIMKKHQISILISVVCICGIVVQNYRLAIMFNNSSGKNRALFGLTELAYLDVKLYLGLALIVALVFGILAIRKAENGRLSILSIVLSIIGILSLPISCWKMMI